MDLLTVIAHELGHVLGFEHADEGVMQEALPAGTRWAAVDWLSAIEVLSETNQQKS